MDCVKKLNCVHTPGKFSSLFPSFKDRELRIRFWSEIIQDLKKKIDQRQTLDVVDTLDGDSSFWSFFHDILDHEITIPWRELPPGIYKINKVHDYGQGEFGPSVVLELESENDEIISVWATTSIVYAMKRRDSNNYICNLGLKKEYEGGIWGGGVELGSFVLTVLTSQ